MNTYATRADASPTYFTVVRELRRTTAALEWAHARLRQCGVEWNRQVEEMEQAGLKLPDCTVRSYHGCVNRPILPDCTVRCENDEDPHRIDPSHCLRTALRAASALCLGSLALLAHRSLLAGDRETVKRCETLAFCLSGSHLSADKIAESWDQVKMGIDKDEKPEFHSEIVCGIVETAVDEAVINLVRLIAGNA